MTRKEALATARVLWHRIADGRMAYGVTMIADCLQFHVNQAVEDEFAKGEERRRVGDRGNL